MPNYVLNDRSMAEPKLNSSNSLPDSGHLNFRFLAATIRHWPWPAIASHSAILRDSLQPGCGCHSSGMKSIQTANSHCDLLNDLA